jgi:hypothetical protein
LIPRYLQVGAAVVTSLTELLLIILAILFTPRSLLPLGSIRVGAKALVASLVMAVIIWMMRTSSLLVILPVAMAIYFITATLLATIPRDDLKALYGSIRNKRQEDSTNTILEDSHQEVDAEEASPLDDMNMLSATEFNTPWRLEWTNPNMSVVGRQISPITDNDEEMGETTIPCVQAIELRSPGESPARHESQTQLDGTELNEDLIPTRKLPRLLRSRLSPETIVPLPQKGRQPEKADEVIK